MNVKIALIGMPGCGKTTIGKMLSEKTKVNLIDLDEYIEEKGESIDSLFEKGEDVFRKCETNCLRETANINQALILSTGGGIVKIKQNVDILKENFIVVFIDRPLDNIYNDIDINTRPLLKNNKEALINLYNERYSLYKDACHIKIDNVFDIEKVVETIIDKVNKYSILNK